MTELILDQPVAELKEIVETSKELIFDFPKQNIIMVFFFFFKYKEFKNHVFCD